MQNVLLTSLFAASFVGPALAGSAPSVWPSNLDETYFMQGCLAHGPKPDPTMEGLLENVDLDDAFAVAYEAAEFGTAGCATPLEVCAQAWRALGELRELDLAYRGITSVDMLGVLRHMRSVDLSNNGIEQVDGLAGTGIEYLDLRGNPLRLLDGLASMPKLQTVLFDQNIAPQVTEGALVTALKHGTPEAFEVLMGEWRLWPMPTPMRIEKTQRLIQISMTLESPLGFSVFTRELEALAPGLAQRWSRMDSFLAAALLLRDNGSKFVERLMQRVEATVPASLEALYRVPFLAKRRADLSRTLWAFALKVHRPPLEGQGDWDEMVQQVLAQLNGRAVTPEAFERALIGWQKTREMMKAQGIPSFAGVDITGFRR